MKKKWRDIRSAVTMMCVMAAMLSSATFAWFTLTSSPTVTGMQMTAASTAGLKITKETTPEDSDWLDAVDISEKVDADIKLSPVSTKEATEDSGVGPAEFYTPVYAAGNVVTGLSDVKLADDNLTGYVAKCTYWLKADGDSDVSVGIITAPPSSQTGDMGVDDDDQAKILGSFVRNANDGGAKDMHAIRAVRVGFKVDGVDNMIIYEPNYETDESTGKAATNNYTDGMQLAKVQSNLTDGKIVKGKGTTDYISEALFTVGTTAKKIDMYIWLEGTDDDCVDEIKLDKLEAQIQFTVVE